MPTTFMCTYILQASASFNRTVNISSWTQQGRETQISAVRTLADEECCVWGASE